MKYILATAFCAVAIFCFSADAERRLRGFRTALNTKKAKIKNHTQRIAAG